MPRLLVVHHSPTPSVAALTEAEGLEVDGFYKLMI